MVWRRASEADLPSIGALLHRHVQSSMFLLGDLRDHGLGSDAPHGMTLWVRPDLSGVFGVSNSGMVLIQAPHSSIEDWRAAHALLAGSALIGCIGETGQVRSFLSACNLAERQTRLDEDEPGFLLELDQLVIPPVQEAALIPLSDAPRDLVEGWRAAYHGEILGTAPENCAQDARRDIAGYLERDSHRVLTISERAVAMTGFNAQIPDVVQVGGVYTPPDLRSRGYARLAVALHLEAAQRAGVERAVLFAASPAAAKAYQAIGFKPAGSFSLVLFALEQEVT